AQQRAYPPELAGRWEFPGGRVEPGEEPEAALRRELSEELDARIVVGERFGVDVPLANGLLLRAYRAELADSAARPRVLEHRAVRWIPADELRALDWVAADRALVDVVAGALRLSPCVCGTHIK
ncbi:MAG: (deoxy)nucleoside triphosphate pyrophosphohydrolase, partial [Sciscionella sp.]